MPDNDPERDPDALTFSFDGQTLVGRRGQTLAAALWAAGIRRLRSIRDGGEARGLWCGVGHCYECRVTVDGVHGVRSCLLRLRADLAAYSDDEAPVVGAEGSPGHAG